MTITIEPVGGTAASNNEALTPGSFAIGLNLDGMEYGGAGAVANFNYAVPSLSEMQYYKSQGQDLIRLPISWSTLQTALNGPLTAAYLTNIKSVVNDAVSLGMKVILDLHDFGGYEGNQLGSVAVTDADFANLWTQLAKAFTGNAGIGGYDLMNEPNNMPSATAWTNAAQAAITAIRTVDTKTAIYVEGNDWANSMNWSSINPGFAQLQDPSNNLVFSAHLYLDTTDSGTNYDWATQAAAGETTQIGVQRLQNFVAWLKANNLKGDIGELGVGNNNPAWLTALDNTLAYAKASNLQVTYWDAGPWLGSYPMSAEPTNGANAPQMAVLDKYSGDYPTLSVAALSGTAGPNETVYLSENDDLLATVHANAAGVWSDTLIGLTNGVHIIVAGENLPTVDGSIGATVFDLVSSTQTQPPVISGLKSGQVTTSEAPLDPFAAVTISDPNPNASETLLITLTGSGGALSGTGLTGGAEGVYTLTGTAASVTGDIQALTFAAQPGAPYTTNVSTFSLSDLSSAEKSATVSGTITVDDIDPAKAPIIAGTQTGQITSPGSAINPFTTASITDPNANATDQLTIKLTGAAGTLTGTGISGGASGVYHLAGTTAEITSELHGLSFSPNPANSIPSVTTLALSDVSSAFATPAVNALTTVLEETPVTVVSSDTTLAIVSTDLATIIVDKGGVEDVLSNGFVTNSELNGGSQIVAAGGTADGTQIGGGGTETVIAGATVSGSVISAGGTEILAWGAAVSGSIDFSGSDATLSVAGSAAPENTIIGFDADGTAGDEIVIPTFPYKTSDKVKLHADNLLSVHLGGTVYHAQFDPSQSFAGDVFDIGANAEGQVVIYDPPIAQDKVLSLAQFTQINDDTPYAAASLADSSRMQFLSNALAPSGLCSLWNSHHPPALIGGSTAPATNLLFDGISSNDPISPSIAPPLFVGSSLLGAMPGAGQIEWIIKHASIKPDAG